MGDGDELATAKTQQVDASLPSSFGGGRYVPRRLLGVGGQKVVFLVDDTKLDRQCALAFMSATSLEESDRERLEREARAMARLGAHAHVVTVFDVGEEDGRPFIVSEFVGGGDLRGALRNGPLAPERVVAIARDVLDALGFVHRNGLVHRDLKPDNVWMTDGGRAKLGDFGIALVADRPRLSVTGALLGTPAYMPPEQLQGERVDGRSDLYALGCMLHELATGRPLFDGALMAVLSQQLYAQPTPASELNPAVPRGLERFILRLVAKNRDDRPATAEDARAELDGLMAPGSIASRPDDPLRALAHAGFVGRDAELRALKSAFEHALEGRPSLQLLVGEPGIGKTRLAQELSLHARLRGARVLFGRCNDAEGSPPYLPFVEALETFFAGETVESLRQRLGDDASTLRELLARTTARLPEIARDPARIDRFALFQATAHLLSRIAGDHGLLVVLEDLHWADKPSLLLLHHIVRNLAASKVLLVASYRDVEVSRQHPLAAVLGDLRRERSVERILLRGLDREQVRALVAAVGDSTDSFVDGLSRQTEGNPLFVQEVLKHLVENGGIGEAATRSRSFAIPEGIRDVIGRRLSRLGEACNRMLARAAAIGPRFAFELLQAIADEKEDTLLDLLDEAVAAQVIRETRDGGRSAYEFTHALIRQTLYEELSGPRRVRLHRQVGEAIERTHRGPLDERVGDLAHHFFEASGGGNVDKAIDYCTRAGDRAVAQVGYEEAALHYARALELVDALEAAEPARRALRCDLYVRRGRAFAMGASYEPARKEFELALAQADTDERRAEVRIDLAPTFLMMMDMRAIAEIAAETLRVAEPLGRADLVSAAMAWRAVTFQAEGDTRQSITDFDRAISTGALRDTQLIAIVNFALTLYWTARFDRVLEHTERVLDASRRLNDVTATMLTLPHRALTLACRGRYREALETFAEGRAFGQRHGNLALVARVVSMCGGTYLALGDHETAEALSEEARELGRAASFTPPVISSGIDLLVSYTRRGELARARSMLAEVATPAEAAGSWHGWVWRMRLEELRAELALAEGDAERAIKHATAAAESATKSGRTKYRVWSHSVRGAALASLGRHDEARADLASAVDEARAMGEPAVLLHALRASLGAQFDEALATEGRALLASRAGAHPEAVTRERLLSRYAIPASGASQARE